jgi:septum formation topological specificity factor MinE
MTSPGERRSDPDFGVGARSYLFSQDVGPIETLREDIIEQVNRYVPYCILDEVTISQEEQYQNAINILIKFTIPQINKRDIFELSISEL